MLRFMQFVGVLMILWSPSGPSCSFLKLHVGPTVCLTMFIALMASEDCIYLFVGSLVWNLGASKSVPRYPKYTNQHLQDHQNILLSMVRPACSLYPVHFFSTYTPIHLHSFSVRADIVYWFNFISHLPFDGYLFAGMKCRASFCTLQVFYYFCWGT